MISDNWLERMENARATRYCTSAPRNMFAKAVVHNVRQCHCGMGVRLNACREELFVVYGVSSARWLMAGVGVRRTKGGIDIFCPAWYWPKRTYNWCKREVRGVDRFDLIRLSQLLSVRLCKISRVSSTIAIGPL